MICINVSRVRMSEIKLPHSVFKSVIVSLLLLLSCAGWAAPSNYHCELGVGGGLGYYIGDATRYPFMDIRETYGGLFRYKFNQRLALQVKGMYQHIAGPQRYANGDYMFSEDGQKVRWENRIASIDALAEYNFMRFGAKTYDRRIKPYTPYIAVGLGMSLYGQQYHDVACYMPVAVGFKWKFSEHCGLNIAWQHNIYFADNLEGTNNFDNTYDLNGLNIMNRDVTSQIILGIVFEFAKEKAVCRMCTYK